MYVTRYIAQARLVKLVDPDAEPEPWDADGSIITVSEVSAIVDAPDDQGAEILAAHHLASLLTDHHHPAIIRRHFAAEELGVHDWPHRPTHTWT